MKKPEIGFFFEVKDDGDFIEQMNLRWSESFTSYPHARDTALLEYFKGNISKKEAMDMIVQACDYYGRSVMGTDENGFKGVPGGIDRILVLEEGSTTRYEVKELFRPKKRYV